MSYIIENISISRTMSDSETKAPNDQKTNITSESADIESEPPDIEIKLALIDAKLEINNLCDKISIPIIYPYVALNKLKKIYKTLNEYIFYTSIYAAFVTITQFLALMILRFLTTLYFYEGYESTTAESIWTCTFVIYWLYPIYGLIIPTYKIKRKVENSMKVDIRNMNFDSDLLALMYGLIKYNQNKKLMSFKALLPMISEKYNTDFYDQFTKVE